MCVFVGSCLVFVWCLGGFDGVVVGWIVLVW